MLGHLEIKDVVDIFCLFDLPEEGEVLHHELCGRLLAVQVQQVNHALTLPRMGGVSFGCGSGSWFLSDAAANPTFYFDADPDPEFY
jgi:hypothetical protein